MLQMFVEVVDDFRTNRRQAQLPFPRRPMPRDDLFAQDKQGKAER